MILPCPLCQARFTVPEEKLKDPNTKIRCPKCHFTFAMRSGGDGGGASVSTDTDPSISQDLVQRVRAEAEQSGWNEGETEGDGTKPVSQQKSEHTGEDATPRGVQPSADVTELDLQEVDSEVSGLSKEEVAAFSEEEIVDADDFAQVAEQSGETTATKKASAKADAEAAGQWPSIIVEDSVPAQTETPQESEEIQKNNNAPGSASTAASTAASTNAPNPQSPQAAVSPQSERFKTVKVPAVSFIEGGGSEPAMAGQDVAATIPDQDEAQLRLQNSMGGYAGSGPMGLSPSAVTETYVIPGRREQPFVGDVDIPDDDDDIRVPKNYTWLWVMMAIVVSGGLIAGAFWFKSKREAESGAKNTDKKQVAEEKADPRWDNLRVGIASQRELKRDKGGVLLVVETSVKNDSKVWRYSNLTLSAELLSSEEKVVDSAWTRCGINLDKEDILKAVKYGGRSGFYSLIEKRALKQEDEKKELGDGEMLPCKLVFFKLPQGESSSDLKYRIEIDRNRTRSVANR